MLTLLPVSHLTPPEFLGVSRTGLIWAVDQTLSRLPRESGYARLPRDVKLSISSYTSRMPSIVGERERASCTTLRLPVARGPAGTKMPYRQRGSSRTTRWARSRLSNKRSAISKAQLRRQRPKQVTPNLQKTAESASTNALLTTVPFEAHRRE